MIQWNKWITDVLPPRLRGLRIKALIKTLLSPMVALYESLILWQEKVYIKASGTPQVCMLKRIIYDELGISVDISEGDGKPVDFIIRTSFTDLDKERQLFALLDRYKLAGKNYAYDNAEITYGASWRNFTCERSRINRITLTYYWTTDTDGRYVYKLTLEAEKRVASDINVESRVHFVSGAGDEEFNISIPLKKNSYYLEMESWMIDRHSSEAIHPQNDDIYGYKLIIKDIYG